MSSEVLTYVNDYLISAWSYTNPNTASFLKSRNSCSIQAVGGNVYALGSGVRVIRFNINSEDFLDVNSLRVQFDIVNNEHDRIN